MKTFKQITLLFTLVLLLMNSSCQKNTEVVKNATQNDADLTASFRNCQNCLVTHTEDDLIGDVIDFFYNKVGNPDSINYDGFLILLQYDKRNRLIKANFPSDGAYFEFKYKSNISPLPVALNYFFPIYGGLIAIDSFRYNIRGEIISRVSTNLLSPQYNLIETYTYDIRGNVIKVDIKAHNGGTVYVPGYTELIVSKYDNRPDFLSGNQWTKFALFDSFYDGGPFLWAAFSRNNAADYVWTYDAQGDSYTVNTNFEYNNEGFANTVNMDWFDNAAGVDLGLFTRTSTSTCDNTTPTLVGPLSAKSSMLQNKLKQLHSGLPVTIK